MKFVTLSSTLGVGRGEFPVRGLRKVSMFIMSFLQHFVESLRRYNFRRNLNLKTLSGRSDTYVPIRVLVILL